MEIITDILKTFEIDELIIRDGNEPEFMFSDKNRYSSSDINSGKAEIYLGNENISNKEKFINFICGSEYLVNEICAVYEIDLKKHDYDEISEVKSRLRGVLLKEFLKVSKIKIKEKKGIYEYNNDVFSIPKLSMNIGSEELCSEEELNNFELLGNAYYSKKSNKIIVHSSIFDNIKGLPIVYHEIGHYLDHATFKLCGGFDLFGTSKTSISCMMIRKIFNDIVEEA